MSTNYRNHSYSASCLTIVIHNIFQTTVINFLLNFLFHIPFILFIFLFEYFYNVKILFVFHQNILYVIKK